MHCLASDQTLLSLKGCQMVCLHIVTCESTALGVTSDKTQWLQKSTAMAYFIVCILFYLWK